MLRSSRDCSRAVLPAGAAHGAARTARSRTTASGVDAQPRGAATGDPCVLPRGCAVTVALVVNFPTSTRTGGWPRSPGVRLALEIHASPGGWVGPGGTVMASAAVSGGSLSGSLHGRLQHGVFRNTTVLVCGHAAADTDELVRAVQAMGGATQTRLRDSSLPHVVICGCTLDESYRVRAGAGCSARRAASDAACGPSHGQRMAAANTMRVAGARGHHSSMLCRALHRPQHAHHPVSPPATTQKLVRTAHQVPVLTRAWLEACMQQQAQVRRVPSTFSLVCRPARQAALLPGRGRWRPLAWPHTFIRAPHAARRAPRVPCMRPPPWAPR